MPGTAKLLVYQSDQRVELTVAMAQTTILGSWIGIEGSFAILSSKAAASRR
jgi:hypothetical protein